MQTIGLGETLKDFVLRLSPQRSTSPITIESRPNASYDVRRSLNQTSAVFR